MESDSHRQIRLLQDRPARDVLRRAYDWLPEAPRKDRQELFNEVKYHEEGTRFARTQFALYKVLSALRMVFTVLLLSAIGVTFGIYVRGYSEQPWVEFMPDDRSFAALFPQPPAHEVEPAPPPFENSQSHLFTANTSHGSYQVTCFDSTMELEAAEAIL